MAAAAGLASLHFVNATGHSALRVVPHGGRDGRGTTNPIAMGIPVEGGGPVILDFATSATAEGKVRVARNKGVPIPPDCLLDADGRPTTDPTKLYTDPPGNLVPFGGATGGHKGGALWLMVDLLAGASHRRRLQPAARRQARFSSSMLSIVIAPKAYADAGAVGAEIRRHVEFVKSARPRTPGGEVLLPGEPERRARAERLASGIPIDPTTWDHIMTSGEQVGLERARPRGDRRLNAVLDDLAKTRHDRSERGDGAASAAIGGGRGGRGPSTHNRGNNSNRDGRQPWHRLTSARSTSSSARPRCCTRSRSRSATASSSCWSGRRAAASRPCSG